jgi:hypothetical protein
MDALHHVAILATWATSAAAAAPQQEPALQPVDQRVEDRNPLAASLRVVERGLDQPNDFGSVYRIDGHDGFARVQGALYALFAESEYVPSKQGLIAVVPAGTVFSIGPPPGAAPAPAAPHAGERFLIRGRSETLVATAERRIEGRAGIQASGPAGWARIGMRPPRGPLLLAPDPGPLVPILHDPEYRARRVTELLHQAAEHAAATTPAGGGAPTRHGRGD